MDVFYLTLNQMLTMVLIMLAGYMLRKTNILPEETHIVLSRLETFVFIPALNVVTWVKNCNTETLMANSSLIFYGALIIAIALVIAYILALIFVPNAKTPDEKYQRNIYKYAFTFGNYGFLGNFMVLGIWGDEVFFKYSMLTLLTAFVCSSWGLIILIPKGQGKVISFRNMIRLIFTPPIIGLGVGMVLGLLNLNSYVPGFVQNSLQKAADCMGPVAMLLSGFVIGGYNLKSLLVNKKVYLATAFRLIIIPTFIIGVLKLIGANETIISLSLIALATPFGMNTIVYPAAYGGDFRTGASMNIISNVISVITIPLMYLLFVVIL